MEEFCVSQIFNDSDAQGNGAVAAGKAERRTRSGLNGDQALAGSGTADPNEVRDAPILIL